MSAERLPVDDLAQLIRRVDGDHSMGAGALADAILAAGYRKPRTITTTEELDTLETRTVVMNSHGEVARKLVYGWRVLVSESGFDAWLSDPLEGIALPATVLYEPAQAPDVAPVA